MKQVWSKITQLQSPRRAKLPVITVGTVVTIIFFLIHLGVTAGVTLLPNREPLLENSFPGKTAIISRLIYRPQFWFCVSEKKNERQSNLEMVIIINFFSFNPVLISKCVKYYLQNLAVCKVHISVRKKLMWFSSTS